MGGLSSVFAKFFPSQDAGVNVPPMDGVFKPNNKLEDGWQLLSLPDIDNLAGAADGLVCSSGNEIYRLSGKKKYTATKIANFAGAVTFIVASDDGLLAVGVEGDGIHIRSPENGWRQISQDVRVSNCVTAGIFNAEGTLFVCVGSLELPASQWKRDLMQRGHCGCVLAIDLASGAIREVASGLAFPNGIAISNAGNLIVSESWRHRIIELDANTGAQLRTLVDALPAYPSRLAAAGDGGYWLTLFAPRRQLIEMVLREDDYRREMMATIEPSDWIGPELNETGSTDQPLQAGSVRQMGIIKPWAPSRSYGLVVKCDADMVPLESWHSRADGTIHGVTSIIEHRGVVCAASRGAGVLVRLEEKVGHAK